VTPASGLSLCEALWALKRGHSREGNVETLATWKAPVWALTFTTDDCAVIHSRTLGEIPVQGDSAFIVELVQRDELMVDEEGSASYIRRPAFVRLGQSGDTVAVDQILELARIFDGAAEVMG
jgi:hypothetical protein